MCPPCPPPAHVSRCSIYSEDTVSNNVTTPVPYRPATPPSDPDSPAFDATDYNPNRAMSDVDYDDEQNSLPTNVQHGSRPADAPHKKGRYDSRVEEWLYENPDSPILITYAGKNLEGGGGYIAYTISTGVCVCLQMTSGPWN